MKVNEGDNLGNREGTMATRLKTIEYGIPQLNSLTDNTLTAMTTITAYIPEFSGTVTIRKAIVELSVNDASTTLGNFNSRRIDVSVGGAGATSYTNSNVYTGSGEQTMVFYAADATTHFTTNWTSGTSKTVAISVLVDDSAASGIILNNVGATLYITYEYDDTQTTQIKTVFIPLNAPVGALATAKPGTATDTIPALDTYCPEASKTYRSVFVVSQGNIVNTGSTTDTTLSMQIDTLTAYTTQTLEMGATSDVWGRFVWTTEYYDSGGVAAGLGMDTSTTHSFYIWASVARSHHRQVFMVVTYEFDASASNDVLVSMQLPMEITSPMGGTASTNAQRGSREVWVEEPGTITTQKLAFYIFWDQAAAMTGLNMRIGTGSYVTYTDAAAILCGGNGAMIRNDAAFTLARGRNSLSIDVYRTDTTDLGFNVSGFWIVNYTAGKPTQGYGAANHTVKWNLNATFDGAASVVRDIAATAPVIPETDYFLTAIGTRYAYISNTTGTAAGVTVLMRDDDDVEWLPAYVDLGYTDPETGLRQCWSQVRSYFKRFPNDLDPGRGDIETSRKWRTALNNNCASFDYLDLYFTYHAITYTVGGDVTGSGGGTVTIGLYRTATRLNVLETTRVGDGAYSFTWYDNTEDVYTAAYEDATHVGRSDTGLAT